MRIVLFYPRGYTDTAGKPSVSTLAVNLPPVGIASCAAVLRKAGHEVTIFDASFQYQYDTETWVAKIIACEPDYVGFSTLTSNFLDAYNVCRGVKESRDKIQTVFGGVHVSWGRETILRHFPAIDFIVAGEGEYSFLDLVEEKDTAQIYGLYFRDGSEIKHGPEQNKSMLCTMDDLPFPAYDLLEGFPKKYAMPLFSYPQHPGASVISSRGCVYHCSFCDRSVFHTSFRWNSPDYTFELITWLNTEFGVKHILFYDDLFTLNRKRVSQLCALLRNDKRRITFNCIVRIGHIDEELIQELKSAGCWMVHVGIESGDQEILDSFKEGLMVEAIRKDVEKLHRGGLWVKGLFMMGFPGETEKSIHKTIEFAGSLPLKDANVTAFTPFPGAPISSDIESRGTFDQDWENWTKMDCVNFVFVPGEIGSKETLEKYYREFIQRFYHRPFMRSIYRKMFFQSPHSYWRLIKHASSFLRYAKDIKK